MDKVSVTKYDNKDISVNVRSKFHNVLHFLACSDIFLGILSLLSGTDLVKKATTSEKHPYAMYSSLGLYICVIQVIHAHALFTL